MYFIYPIDNKDNYMFYLSHTAARRLDCEWILALSKIYECWSCMEPHRLGYGRHRFWERDEYDEWREDDRSQGPDAYDFIELIDSEITLTHWIDSEGKQAEPISASIGMEIVCASTPTLEVPAYASEYEGYTGNAGNTMDRWYRRAALVIWPRRNSFVVRAKSSPSWAIESLQELLRGGEVKEARKKASSLLDFWQPVLPSEEQLSFFEKTLEVAEGLAAPELAASLLEPFHTETLAPSGAPAFVGLARRYGDPWMQALVTEWGSQRNHFTKEALAWAVSFPTLCEALLAVDKDLGRACAQWLSDDLWLWMCKAISSSLNFRSPSLSHRVMVDLAQPLFGVLESVEILDDAIRRDAIVAFLCIGENERLIATLIQILGVAADNPPKNSKELTSIEALRRHCIENLENFLDSPARPEGDWSIEFPGECECNLCTELRKFLEDSTQQRLDWPLNKEKRRHVHREIDAYELPVRHTTRRSGRPYTLVLSKRKDLFKREASKRQEWQDALDWLTLTH